MSGELRILEGATFCICDDLGDLHGNVEGLFTEDTRFLSSLKLTINGKRPLLLSSDKIEYFSAAFFMRNPLTDGSRRTSCRSAASASSATGMQDSFLLQNQSMERVEFDLELDVGADFADIFAVKDFDFALGDPLRAKPLPERRPVEYDPERNQFLISDDGELPLKTQVIFSKRGEGRRLDDEVPPRARAARAVGPARRGLPAPRRRARRAALRRAALRRGGRRVSRLARGMAAARAAAALVVDASGHAFGQSVSDLASLRMRSDNGAIGKLPGRGVPWFMTVFGRDTIITCLQTLLFGPELAAHRARGARRPAGEGGRSDRATPSRARSCTRCATARPARTWHERLLRHGRRDARCT
jgi:glycogen debranching enzyme